MATNDEPQLVGDDKAVREGTDFSAGTAFGSPLRDFRQWFGGPGVKTGPRISPVVVTSVADSDNENSAAILDKQRALEANAAIQYRTCSWQKVCLCLSPLPGICGPFPRAFRVPVHAKLLM